jgi:hypothetical protein
VQYCFLLPSRLTFSVYMTLWAWALTCRFLRLCRTLRSGFLENDRSHTYVFIQTVRFWKRIFSYMSAWLPIVTHVLSFHAHTVCHHCFAFSPNTFYAITFWWSIDMVFIFVNKRNVKMFLFLPTFSLRSWIIDVLIDLYNIKKHLMAK